MEIKRSNSLIIRFSISWVDSHYDFKDVERMCDVGKVISVSVNLVPRVRVTLDQRSGTRDSGIKRFGSHFHWLKSEHEQLDRK